MRGTDRGGGAAGARALIAEASARNTPMQLHYAGPSGEELVARCRILGVDERHVYLDSPHAIGRPVRFERDQTVTGHFPIGDDRYSFKSVVVQLRCVVQLNREKCVVGMVLRRPRLISRSQRRSSYRVSLLGDETITVSMHAALPGGNGVCSIDALRFHGSLVNLSVGGAGLLVERDVARRLSLDDLVFMTLRLPGEPEAFHFLAEIRQMRALDGGAVRLGLKAKPWPTKRDLERMQERIQRYVTAVQRERIRHAA